eukprot:CAMPEP_0194343204 /NCGR_PEP_ID=MMETSP0171-20130528/95706_1 /TAXON_ID=218684 /ORGANISM="Corethron pennatum, Strain L29A3" /LENGTH=57 /DNA_ID=CAMNT_0039109277 /DNA_START=63 /DNA_END=233 /DNA_ORIENTATION=-
MNRHISFSTELLLQEKLAADRGGGLVLTISKTAAVDRGHDTAFSLAILQTDNLDAFV